MKVFIGQLFNGRPLLKELADKDGWEGRTGLLIARALLEVDTVLKPAEMVRDKLVEKLGKPAPNGRGFVLEKEVAPQFDEEFQATANEEVELTSIFPVKVPEKVAGANPYLCYRCVPLVVMPELPPEEPKK